MKTIITILLLSTPLLLKSQIQIVRDSVYSYNETTQKVKKCEWVVEDSHLVEFRITESSVKTFIKVDINTWTTFNKKVVSRVEKEGWVLFVDGKKVYAYKKKLKNHEKTN
jgi:hypothetical protein